MVTKGKFLVVSLYNVNDAAHSIRASDIKQGRGAAKLRTYEIPQNSLEILSNTCQYNIFETYLSYWGKFAIYFETSSPQPANNVTKLPGINYVAKNWTLPTMLKALTLAHFSRALLLE